MQTYSKDSFCSFCGSEFPVNLSYPKTCNHCKQVTYINPIPVSVILVPFQNGVFSVRRGIEPGIGKLALPGGFVDAQETWEEAGARELKEELQILIEPDQIELFSLHSTEDKKRILFFGVYPPSSPIQVLDFVPTQEAQERVILYSPTELVFPLHTKVLQEYFLLKK